MRTVRRLAILCCLVLATVVPSVPAYASCNTGRSDDGRQLQDGTDARYTRGTVIGGVYSDLYNYSPYVPVGWTYDYSMVYAGLAWAQIGWIQYPGSRNTLIEWTGPGVGQVNNIWKSPMSVGSYSYYTVLYNNPGGYMSFQVNGATWYQTPNTFTPYTGEVSGEVATGSDQMPGGYNAHQYQGDMHIYYNGAWHNWYDSQPSPYNQDTNIYGNTETGNIDYIWDKACAS